MKEVNCKPVAQFPPDDHCHSITLLSHRSTMDIINDRIFITAKQKDVKMNIDNGQLENRNKRLLIRRVYMT